MAVEIRCHSIVCQSQTTFSRWKLIGNHCTSADERVGSNGTAEEAQDEQGRDTLSPSSSGIEDGEAQVCCAEQNPPSE